MIAPCKDCVDRKLLCHGHCEKYQTWKAEQDAIVEERERQRKATPDLSRKVVRQIWKELKWH